MEQPGAGGERVEVDVEVGASDPGGPPPDLIRRLDARVRDEQAEQRLPSLVAGLARDGGLVWWASSGTTGTPDRRPPTTDTQYRIGSISKTFVAVSVMRLRDEGLLDLGDPVGDHLPELAHLPITLAQLLSHTSGLRAETAGAWWERVPGMPFTDLVASSLRPADLLWRPGRRFHYSNTGYAVLGELVARKRSASFGDVIQSDLLDPLGMARTTLRPVAPHADGLAVHPHAPLVLVEPEHDAIAMAPAGQLWSTIEDLARWAEVLAGRLPQILKPESLAEMTEPLGLADIADQPWAVAHGLGLQLWNHGGRRRYGHAGAMPGFWAMLVVDRATRDIVVSLANSTYSGLRPAFFDELLSLLESEHPRPPSPFRPDGAGGGGGGGGGGGAIELLGTWYWGPVEYRMSLARGGNLELRGVSPGRDCALRPNGDGTYTADGGYFSGERLELHRRGDGSLSHLDIASFVFTRSPYDQDAGIPGGLDEGWTSGGPT